MPLHPHPTHRPDRLSIQRNECGRGDVSQPKARDRGHVKPRAGAYSYAVRDRFEAKMIPEPNTGCWLWIAADQPTGYGQMWTGRTREGAHRISYKMFCGEIADGLEIDHRCRNRWCVNPDHLRAVTHRENMRCSNAIMGENARKTHCIRGHELTGDNLRIVRGSRQCRECTNFRARRAKRAKKQRLAGAV